jgi:hypothetical protein
LKASSRLWLPALTLLISSAAGSSEAQTYFTPSIGMAFGGVTDDSKLSYGGDLAFVGGGALGGSVDFGFTRNFFGESASGSGNNVTTLMGNLMLISPGKPRFYASGGLGLLKTRVQDVPGFLDVDSNDWGMNAGAGVYIIGDGSVGFRGDIRYFRRLTDPEPDGEFDVEFGALRYWRASAGVTLRF